MAECRSTHRLPSSASFQFSIPRPILARRTLIDCIALRDRVEIDGGNHGKPCVPGSLGRPGKPSLITSLAQTDTSGAARGRRHKCASLRADACGRIPERDGVERLRDYWRLVACGGILSWTLRRVQTNFSFPACCSVANWTPTRSSFACPSSRLLQLRRPGPSHHRHRHCLYLGRKLWTFEALSPAP